MKKFRFIPLFVLLIAFLVIHPFWGDGPREAVTFNIFLTLIIAAGVYAVGPEERRVVWALGLGVPWFFLIWSEPLTPNPFTDLASHIFAVLFYAYLAVNIFILSFSARRVIGDIVFGAISGYLLLGLIWASFFAMADAIAPNSFSVNARLIAALGHEVNWRDLMFFSFTTLTTLGYGDITPVGPAVRMLASLEAVIGVLYIAFLISRLGALYYTRPNGRPNSRRS